MPLMVRLFAEVFEPNFAYKDVRRLDVELVGDCPLGDVNFRLDGVLNRVKQDYDLLRPLRQTFFYKIRKSAGLNIC